MSWNSNLREASVVFKHKTEGNEFTGKNIAALNVSYSIERNIIFSLNFEKRSLSSVTCAVSSCFLELLRTYQETLLILA